MTIEYWFGREDEEELFEYECTPHMIRLAIYNEFKGVVPSILCDILNLIEDDDLFYEFYDIIKDYFEKDAKSAWRERNEKF